jgi:hypothetical protein
MIEARKLIKNIHGLILLLGSAFFRTLGGTLTYLTARYTSVNPTLDQFCEAYGTPVREDFTLEKLQMGVRGKHPWVAVEFVRTDYAFLRA